jgi:hypothetical protein
MLNKESEKRNSFQVILEWMNILVKIPVNFSISDQRIMKYLKEGIESRVRIDYL